MANHKSALKRIRQNAVRTVSNKDRISRVRTFVKKFIASLGTHDAVQSFVAAQSEIHKGVVKGVLHRNTAARKISRLSKLLKSVEAK